MILNGISGWIRRTSLAEKGTSATGSESFRDFPGKIADFEIQN
jgi:hypothetical protein